MEGQKFAPHTGFIEGDAGFGFVDPADIICGVHLIPRFTQG
jgi:hypothetical protein